MKKLIFFTWLSLTSITLYGQEAYLNLESKIEKWMTSTKQEVIIPINDSYKTIEFLNYGYSITGYFKKGYVQAGSWITISDNKNNYKLSGVVLRNSQVKGVIEESNGICTYGVFDVSNHTLGNIINKIKQAQELQITNVQVEYYKGYYNDCPTILSMNPASLAIDGKTAGRGYYGFYCPLKSDVVDNIGYKNLKELILTADENCCLQKGDLHKFLGTVKPVLTDTGYIAFMRLEGDEINIPGAAETKISVKREGDVVKLLRIYKPDDIMVSDELTAPSSLIPDEKLRDIRTFYQNVIEICSIFRDGSSYRGKVKVNIVDSADGKTFTPKLTLTHGTYTFSNGDVFTGNLSGQYYGGIPIDGTMKFADGTEASGNWLKKYNLTQKQANSLISKKFPTTIRGQAKEYQRAAEERAFFETYIKYETLSEYNRIHFFSPDAESLNACYPSYLLYNKKTGYYTCISKKDEILLSFKVDNKGQHIVETIYSNTENNKPKYINILTYYSNGKVQSIKSYHYDSRQIYLVVNFFSDGIIKNAYMYDRGNSNKIILRKSKESHPTLGGFTSKLYDLDGNYEKTIEWHIGEWHDLYKTEYANLNPGVLDLSKFKQIEYVAKEIEYVAKDKIFSPIIDPLKK